MKAWQAATAVASVAFSLAACSNSSGGGQKAASSFVPAASPSTLQSSSAGQSSSVSESSSASAAATEEAATTSAPPPTSSSASPSPSESSRPAESIDAATARIRAGTISMKGYKARVDYVTTATGDPARDAALMVWADEARALIQAMEKQDAQWPALAQTAAADGLKYEREGVADSVKKHWASSGVLRLWNAKASEVHKGSKPWVQITSCGSQKDWLTLDLKTGKTLPNRPGENDNFEQTAVAAEMSPGEWRITLIGPPRYRVARCAK